MNVAARNRELGAERRKQRESVGVTGAELAVRVGWSASKVSRIENGLRSVSPVEVVQYLGHCGIFRVKALGLLDLCRSAELNLGYWLSPYGMQLPDSLGSLIYHEKAAQASTSYQPDVIPGLLQTADYARTRIAREQWRSPEDIEHCVRIRLQRQRILRSPHPTPSRFYLNEATLRLEVGGPAVMHEQLLKIVLMGALDHVTIRVVPASAGERSAVGGPFSLFRFAEHAPLMYIDLIGSGLFLEDKRHVEPYRDLVPDIAEVALNPDESREFIAELANQYGRRTDRDLGDHSVE